MIDRDKVIKGLEHHSRCQCSFGNGDICPYWSAENDSAILCRDALELLKAQEPRVMMADEVEKWVRQKPIDREPIYVEVKDSFCAWMVNDYCDYLPETDLSPELYGKTWRVWSAKPTEEERKKAEWDEP